MATYDGSFNTRLTATLANNGTDTYKLAAGAGGRLQFTFVHPDGPGTTGNTFNLAMLDAAGGTVFQRDVQGNVTLDTTVAAAGDYYLSIKDGDWSAIPPGTYAITTTLSGAAGTVFDGTSNNSSATALDAPLGSPIVGSMAYNDTDVFRIHAASGGALTLAFVHPSGAGSTGAQIDIEVIDENGAIVAAQADLQGNATITATVAQAGDYYIKLLNNYLWNRNDGLYTVTPTMTSVARTVYDGPSNDTSASAIAAPLGAPIVGSLKLSDTDVFKLTSTAGGVLKLDFTHPSGAGGTAPPIGIEIMDTAGRKVLDRELRGDTTLTTTVATGGDYFIHVTGGSYQSGDEGLYRIGTHFTTAPGTVYDGAANGTAAAAQNVAAGQAVVGTLDAGDLDYFAIHAAAPGTLTVGFWHPAGASTSGTGIALSIVDGSGKALFEKYENGNDLVAVELPGAGTYYVKLADGTTWDSIAPGQYSLMTGVAGSGGGTLRGTAANDYMVNTGGSDVVNGGTGTDTVKYYGNAGLYAITASSAGASVTGNGGTDTLFSVERVAFDDRMVALDTEGVPAQAYRIYQAAFDRAPDLAGLGYWIAQMDAGAGLKAVAQAFIDSAEFHAMYGAAPGHRDMVTKFYQNVLHRAPDQAGLDYWVGVLDRHQTDAAGVLMGFSESPENAAQLVGAMSAGIAYIPLG